jgi:AcrR family transcriptional regulator
LPSRPPPRPRNARRDSERTRLRILDAAERLFSQHGLDGVSMRDIALTAGAPLALANYHFGSKDGLYRAVFRRRIEPISAERRARLAQVMGRAGPPAGIEAVLDALARPWVELRARPGGGAYARLVAREAGDPAEGRRGIVREMLDPIAREFIAAMIRALPGVPRARIHWAYNFFIGALLLILANPARVRRLSGGLCKVGDDDAVVREIVTFFSSALGAAANPPRRRSPPAVSKPKGAMA